MGDGLYFAHEQFENAWTNDTWIGIETTDFTWDVCLIGSVIMYKKCLWMVACKIYDGLKEKVSLHRIKVSLQERPSF